MRHLALMLPLVLPALAGCGGDGDPQQPGEGFRKDVDVVVVGLSNGETVASPFVLAYEAGSDVSKVQLDVDEDVVVAATPVGDDGHGELLVTLDPGRYRLVLRGLDAQGAALSQYALTVRVAEAGDSWVTITSPSDGAVVQNPVGFAVDASADVDRITLLADDWELGSVAPGQVLPYAFTGTGFEREVEAQAFAGDVLVASDTITLTVDAGTEPLESDFNQAVLDVVGTYPTDGSYGYYWPSTGDWKGTTRDIWYRDALVAEGDPSHRSYCSGITWETFMRAWSEVDRETGGDGTINGMDVDDLTDFRVDWYVRELFGDGVGIAIEGYGLGERVTDWTDLQPGDFVQIWRHSGSGHTFVFVEWLKDGDGAIEGVRYWSSQGSTDGIGYNEEYFGASGGSLDPTYFYAARVYDPADWIPWF